MSLIHEMAIHNTSRIEAMRTRKSVPGWDDILLLGGQLAHPPLADKADVDTTTIIGKNARKPMVLDHAVYVSHMSFGALSKEAKTALAKGTAAVHTAQYKKSPSCKRLLYVFIVRCLERDCKWYWMGSSV